MVEANAEGKAQQMGGAENGGSVSENDPHRDTAATATSSVGGSIGGRLPRAGGTTGGKDLGQLVAKQLEYQLAYHSSSVQWYETEIQRCHAEIEKFREAMAWHEAYLAEAQADLEDFLAPLPSEETPTTGE